MAKLLKHKFTEWLDLMLIDTSIFDGEQKMQTSYVSFRNIADFLRRK
jgi:hypothetical protein